MKTRLCGSCAEHYAGRLLACPKCGTEWQQQPRQAYSSTYEPPQTKEEWLRSKANWAKFKTEWQAMLKKPKRVGAEYWQWVLDEAASRKTVPYSTLVTAREVLDKYGRAQSRQPGDDFEEDGL